MAPPHASHLNLRRVLVADDSAATRNFIISSFLRVGFEVDTVENGARARAHDGARYVAVFLDLDRVSGSGSGADGG